MKFIKLKKLSFINKKIKELFNIIKVFTDIKKGLYNSL